MTVTAAMISKVKRMTGETGSDDYESDITAAIAAYPLVDSDGNDPDDTDWVATYCLNSAAADVMEMKAAVVVADYDFSADGTTYNRSQVYEQMMKQARRYRSRRAPKTLRARMEPRMLAQDSPWIGNAAEEDD